MFVIVYKPCRPLSYFTAPVSKLRQLKNLCYTSFQLRSERSQRLGDVHHLEKSVRTHHEVVRKSKILEILCSCANIGHVSSRVLPRTNYKKISYVPHSS